MRKFTLVEDALFSGMGNLMKHSRDPKRSMAFADVLEKRMIRPQEIMARIKKETFKQIGKHWHHYPDGIEMPEFVLLVS
jgi:hypothetical protein